MPRRPKCLDTPKRDSLDVEGVLRSQEWLLEPKQDCIISPDSDGLLCGLLMSNVLDWRIRGFYDGKVCVVDEQVSAKDCVFLDVEIFRPNTKSVGQHMLLMSNRRVPHLWEDHFRRCVSPNNLRGYDKETSFACKYPFGTIHLLMTLLSEHCRIDYAPSGRSVLLFVDGMYHNLFRYTENCRDWARYLGWAHRDSPLHSLLCVDQYSMMGLMEMMDEFWRARDHFSEGAEAGDRLHITNRRGTASGNLVGAGGGVELQEATISRFTGFIGVVSERLGWRYDASRWSWGRYRATEFQKGSLGPGSPQGTLGIRSYGEILDASPVSFAITASDRLEYTLDPGGLFDKA